MELRHDVLVSAVSGGMWVLYLSAAVNGEQKGEAINVSIITYGHK